MAGLNAGWGHPVNRKNLKQGQEELLIAFGGAFPVRGVPVIFPSASQ